MPPNPKRPCAKCGKSTTEKYCPKCKPLMMQAEKARLQRYDKERGTATQRWYDVRWNKARKMYLADNPLCVECLKEGRLTPATVVDHIIPHKGDYFLFWDEGNWQSLCATHHAIKTAKEDGGFGNEQRRVQEV